MAYQLPTHGAWDEMFSNAGIRQRYHDVYELLQKLPTDVLDAKHKQAADFFMNQGISIRFA